MSPAKTLPKEDFILLVLSMGTGEHVIVSSTETLKLVAIKINSVDAKLALAGNRPISRGGIVFVAQSTDGIQRHEAERKRTELVIDLAVSRPRKRTPGIILFDVDPNISYEGTVHAVL